MMKSITAVLLVPLLWLLWISSAVAAELLQAGVHYDLITPAVPTHTSRPEIVEMFNFKCPHCYTLHRELVEWGKKNHQRFNLRSLPIFWGSQTDLPARAFFTAQAMGKGPEMQTALFRAHFDQNANIESENDLMFLAEEIGLDNKQFQAKLRDFGISTQVSQALQLKKEYGVASTPTLVVNGRYRLQSRHASGSWSRMLIIAETLATMP
ncbi:MAG: thiol:disulfide interchange protein DsbA/DsbL [Magnetococcales bacterium]|nr:thiol:disulfide interchange protein DsbA/DsbL [Magnetococcales bacterium]